MNDRHIRLITTAGILSAAIFIAIIAILAAMLLPAGYAALCAGVGSMLADLIGFPVYAPITFLVKGLTALAFALLWRQNGKRRYFAFLSILIVPVGYFLFELVLFRNYAWVDLPLNLLQATTGAGLALALDRMSGSAFRI